MYNPVIKLTIIATGFPTTETLIRRDIEKTVVAAQRVEGNEDSLDLPPFLRRNLGGFSVTNTINQNGHSSGPVSYTHLTLPTNREV